MENAFKVKLFLPAQAAVETEATITKWYVKAGDQFKKGQAIAEIESAKSTFDFEAPCDGKVVELLVKESGSTPIETPVVEIETTDPSMKQDVPLSTSAISKDLPTMEVVKNAHDSGDTPSAGEISLLGIGAYLPERIVSTKELLMDHPDITEEYMVGVTGIKERRWARPDEKPSDMAYAAAKQAIERSGIDPKEIGAIILATDTPDVMMPSTSCILQEKLGLRGVPAFDLNAACSGWIYAITVAKGLILSGIADNVLAVAVDIQSRLLDKKDRDTYFLFGDGAGATVVSGVKRGHLIKKEMISADSQGLHMARRSFPGHEVPENTNGSDPWLRLDGKALFRFATQSFSFLVREVVSKSGWQASEVRWVVPHQANQRIIKAAAQKSGLPFERFYLNIDRVGNTSCASIPIALSEIQNGLQKGDKLVFCTVGAGITAGAMSVEW